MLRNVFYFRYINIIGGIEQFFAYLCEKYTDWDITIVYKDGDPSQISRLKQFARVVKFDGQQIECDKAFFCFNRDIIEYVNANTTYLVLHGDYGALVDQKHLCMGDLPIDPRIDKYLGVSQVVCDSWKRLTGIDCELAYNPFLQAPKKNILRLVYCGRLAKEKGGELANKLISRLSQRGIDYVFYVYSNGDNVTGENVVYLGTRLDACQYLNQHNYDYIVVPSMSEGYCYSLVQALANGLPAIVTPCDVFPEVGVNDKNSIRLEFDGSNIDEVIDKMLTSNFNFQYSPKDDAWDKILSKGSSTYDGLANVKCKVLVKYFDTKFNRMMEVGEIYEAPRFRAEEVLDHKFIEILEGQ